MLREIKSELRQKDKKELTREILKTFKDGFVIGAAPGLSAGAVLMTCSNVLFGGNFSTKKILSFAAAAVVIFGGNEIYERVKNRKATTGRYMKLK